MASLSVIADREPWAETVESHGPCNGLKRDERTTTGDDAEQTSNIARGTPETLADLRHYHASTSLDVARRRGPWVPRGLRRSARPSFGGSTKKRRSDGGLPGGRSKIRATTHVRFSARLTGV